VSHPPRGHDDVAAAAAGALVSASAAPRGSLAVIRAPSRSAATVSEAMAALRRRKSDAIWQGVVEAEQRRAALRAAEAAALAVSSADLDLDELARRLAAAQQAG
jgi:hypothetical protein